MKGNRCFFCNPTVNTTLIVTNYLHKNYNHDSNALTCRHNSHNQYAQQLFKSFPGGLLQFQARFQNCFHPLARFYSFQQIYQEGTSIIRSRAMNQSIHIMHFHDSFYSITRKNQVDHNNQHHKHLKIVEQKKQQKLQQRGVKEPRLQEEKSIHILSIANSSLQELKAICKQLGVMCKKSAHQTSKFKTLFIQHLQKYQQRKSSISKKQLNFKKTLEQQFSKIMSKETIKKKKVSNPEKQNQDIYGLKNKSAKDSKRNRSKNRKDHDRERLEAQQSKQMKLENKDKYYTKQTNFTQTLQLNKRKKPKENNPKLIKSKVKSLQRITFSGSIKSKDKQLARSLKKATKFAFYE